MISISTITASATGNVAIKENIASDTGAKTARISRTATLDGGVYINHSGFTHGDRTLKIRGRISQAKATLLSSIFEDQTSSLISFSDGIFLGAISALNTQNGSLNMTFLIEQKEN